MEKQVKPGVKPEMKKGSVPKGYASSKIPVRVKWQGAGSVRHGSGRGKRHG